MNAQLQFFILFVSVFSVVVVGCTSEVPTATPTVNVIPEAIEEATGHQFFISKGCVRPVMARMHKARRSPRHYLVMVKP